MLWLPWQIAIKKRDESAAAKRNRRLTLQALARIVLDGTAHYIT
jgi:hypothetical protein